MISSTSLDKLAVVLSGVCVLHCLITPIVITLLPIFTLSALVEDLLFHKLMLWLVLPTSFIALFIGCRKHRNLLILGSGILGMALLVLIALFAHSLMSDVQEKVATSVAGIILAISHILNFRACQQRTCDDKNCSSEHHH
ncbi:MAG: MerC domain-containing protein [Gammaproteobacteria bacterium]|nr:MerC domain-containing protein [Gammaproteobacteria bacterium]